ncbi:AMP-binding protein [Pseudonocardia ailaonensis]|uniref:AMP-binding protein n=1 Tax=Pseudonocardia ailaonensis TaxID=367279 RepID=A0ABN2NDC1_9PSEU
MSPRIAHLIDLLDHAVDIDAERVAVTVDGEDMTYTELAAASTTIARGLRALGVERGDRVAVWLPNSPQWIAILLGCARLEAVAVPINTWYRSRELGHVLARSGARVLFTQERFLRQDYGQMLSEVAEASTNPLGRLDHIVCLSGHIDRAMPFGELTALSGPLPADQPDPDAAFLMSFTSGTTSSPKGALLTQRGITTNAVAFAERLEVGPGAAVYCAVPFFHVAGLAFATLCAMSVGGTLVANGRFTGSAAWKAIAEHGCAHTGGFEAIYHALLDAQPPVPVRTLRSAWWGGGPPALFTRVEQALGARLMNLYGLTEASGNVTSTPLSWTAEQRAGSEGVGLNGASVRIVDNNHRSVPTGVTGEICVSSATIMLGYHDDPDATRQALLPVGHLMTGDLGHLDPDGNLHFSGRRKDMIKVGGENVSPQEIEAALGEFPEIIEVAVIGIPDTKYGEVPVAFARTIDGVTADEVLDRLRGTIASFKMPRRLTIVDEFPRSSTGKIQKTRLRSSPPDGLAR